MKLCNGNGKLLGAGITLDDNIGSLLVVQCGNHLAMGISLCSTLPHS